MSLVTDPDNLFDKDKGIYVAGQQYVDWKKSPQYNPRKSEWDTDNAANFFSKGKEWEREASITYFDNGELGFTQNMGIRIKGASTRNSQTKSFNFYARSSYGDSKLDYKLIDDNYSAVDGDKIKRYDSFSLRSVAWVDRLRERVVHSSLRDLPALATYDSDRCMLFIDGELWGMYEIIEKSSDYYIQSNYGVPAEDVAMIKNGELETGAETDYDDLEALCDYCLDHDLSVQSDYDYVASKVDVESLIDCYCAGLYLGTWDWPNHNYLMWRNNGNAIDGNPYSDGKWRFGSFDFDYSVGLTYQSFGGVEGYQYDILSKAVEKGIKVVGFDCGGDHVEGVTYTTQDDKSLTQISLDALIEKAEEAGAEEPVKIIEVNTLGAIVPFDTRHSVIEEYKEAGKLEVVQLVSPSLSGDFYSEVNTGVSTTLANNPDVQGIWTASTAFLDGILDATTSADRNDIVVTGIDISDTEVQRLATTENYYCCAAVDPYVIGVVDVRIAVQKVLGAETPEEYQFPAVGVFNTDVKVGDTMATLAETIDGFGSSEEFKSDELEALRK